MTQGRVLIIDDDQMMRNSLVDLTEAAGWTPKALARATDANRWICLLYTSPSPRDQRGSRMPSSA